MKNALKNEVVKVEKVDAPIYLKSKSLLRVVVGKKVSVKFHSPLTNSVVRYSHCSKIPFHAQKLPLKIAENKMISNFCPEIVLVKNLIFVMKIQLF